MVFQVAEIDVYIQDNQIKLAQINVCTTHHFTTTNANLISVTLHTIKRRTVFTSILHPISCKLPVVLLF